MNSDTIQSPKTPAPSGPIIIPKDAVPMPIPTVELIGKLQEIRKNNIFFPFATIDDVQRFIEWYERNEHVSSWDTQRYLIAKDFMI